MRNMSEMDRFKLFLKNFDTINSPLLEKTSTALIIGGYLSLQAYELTLSTTDLQELSVFDIATVYCLFAICMRIGVLIRFDVTRDFSLAKKKICDELDV